MHRGLVTIFEISFCDLFYTFRTNFPYEWLQQTIRSDIIIWDRRGTEIFHIFFICITENWCSSEFEAKVRIRQRNFPNERKWWNRFSKVGSINLVDACARHLANVGVVVMYCWAFWATKLKVLQVHQCSLKSKIKSKLEMLTFSGNGRWRLSINKRYEFQTCQISNTRFGFKRAIKNGEWMNQTMIFATLTVDTVFSSWLHLANFSSTANAGFRYLLIELLHLWLVPFVNV